MSYYNSNFSLPEFFETALYDSVRKVNIKLPPETYTMDHSFVLKNHDVVIKGSTDDNGFTTTIIIDENILFGEGIHSVFKIFGQFDSNTDDKISVEIRDLIIQTNVSQSGANNHESAITQFESQIFAFRNIKSLKMRNVKIVCQNIATTCVEVKRGYNIDIRNCTFANFNRRKVGGVLWLRGDTVNARIEHCDIYKYGGDEAIGIWNPNNFEGYNIISNENLQQGINEIHKRNIRIRHNRIFCQDANGGENKNSIITEDGNNNNNNWSGSIERVITLFTNQDNNTIQGGVQNEIPCHYILEGIEFSNNIFQINSPIAHLITIALDKHTTFKDISIRNNIINYGNWAVEGSNGSVVLDDFDIYYDTLYDYSQIPGDYNLTSDEPFYITGNTIICGSNARNDVVYENNEPRQYADNHRCLDIQGAKVIFNDNYIVCNRGSFTLDESSYARKGLQLFNCKNKGGEVMFSNNHCEGLKSLMVISGISNNVLIPLIKITGRGNYLHGNTRITHTHVSESHVSMTGNELVCDYPLFFLSEFANTGTARFIGNKVTRDMSRATNYTTPRGQLYYTGQPGNFNNINSMKLICCDNIFDNISYNSTMYNDIGRISNIEYIHTNNIFDDLIE